MTASHKLLAELYIWMSRNQGGRTITDPRVETATATTTVEVEVAVTLMDRRFVRVDSTTVPIPSTTPAVEHHSAVATLVITMHEHPLFDVMLETRMEHRHSVPDLFDVMVKRCQPMDLPLVNE
jgi:hypothetical protein